MSETIRVNWSERFECFSIYRFVDGSETGTTFQSKTFYEPIEDEE